MIDATAFVVARDHGRQVEVGAVEAFHGKCPREHGIQAAGVADLAAGDEQAHRVTVLSVSDMAERLLGDDGP